MAVFDKITSIEDKIDVNDVFSSASMDWSPLGETFVKMYSNYDFLDWDIDPTKYKVAIAPFGGPVAVLLRAKGEPLIHIYSLTGAKYAAIKFEGGKIVNIGWTASERLLAIFEDGTISVYTLLGEKLYSTLLAREINEGRVLECKFFHTLEGYGGFAVMTYQYKFFVVSDSDRDKDSLRVKAMAELPTNSIRPSCWTILPQGNNVSIVAAIEDRVYNLVPFEVVTLPVACRKQSPQWVQINISINGKAAALIDKDGYLWAGSSDFKVSQTEFDIQSPSTAVRQMEWSCNDFVAVLYDKFIFLKGLGKHWCKLPLIAPSVIQCEVDGIRILSKESCDFLHRVPSQTLAVLKVASLQPGAILNDAYKEYKGDESHKADEFIRYVKDKLPEAVKQCIEAASEEYHPTLQQALLLSANFGKGFIGPDITPELVYSFEWTCRDLRVLNTVRHRNIGIPITHRQYSRLSHGVLIDRLISRGLYPLALELCNYLNIRGGSGQTKVLRQWAMRKVTESPDDAKVADLILDRFKSYKVVTSFVDIARIAREEGKKQLAAQLLEHECHVSDQVQMLLEMEETGRALDKAIGSWDSQLVYEVLDAMKEAKNSEEFMSIFRQRPVAAALYKKYCKENDPEGLINLCLQDSNFLEAGILFLQQSYNNVPDPKGRLFPKQRELKRAHKEFVDGQLIFQLKVLEDQERLIHEQERIKSEISVDLIGFTLFDTVLELIRRGQPKLAENLKKKFSMSDQLFWWAKIRGLADVANFEELERFSKQKKSPIGYEPFVDICLNHKRFREAVKYIPRCSNENKSRLYIMTGDWPKAVESALACKDVGALNEIEARQGRNPEIAQMVKQAKAKLGVL